MTKAELEETRQSLWRNAGITPPFTVGAMMESNSETGPRTLSAIAGEIAIDWGAKVNYAARPYLEAMRELDSIEDNYMFDSARSVVLYFLSNASTWRGDVARRVKAELKEMARS